MGRAFHDETKEKAGAGTASAFLRILDLILRALGSYGVVVSMRMAGCGLIRPLWLLGEEWVEREGRSSSRGHGW